MQGSDFTSRRCITRSKRANLLEFMVLAKEEKLTNFAPILPSCKTKKKGAIIRILIIQGVWMMTGTRSSLHIAPIQSFGSPKVRDFLGGVDFGTPFLLHFLKKKRKEKVSFSKSLLVWIFTFRYEGKIIESASTN